MVERASIQPICVIDEKANRGRSCVCARPLMAPVKLLITLRSMTGNMRDKGRLRLNKRNKGVSFCQVKRVDAAGQLSEAIVDGNHWCIGAIPALVIKAIRSSMGLRLFQGVSHVVGARRNRMEPVAWARKYLHVAPVLSEETFVGWYEINGINERRFISIPSQAISQLGAVREIKVPRIRLAIKSRDEIGIIKEEISYGGGLSPMH